MMESAERSLAAADYISFAILMILSTGIGIYFAYKDKNNNSIDSYYFADKKVNPIPLAMSMFATFLSTSNIISEPVESYIVGTTYLWVLITTLISSSISVVYFVPAFRRMGLRTKFEFLELRFNDLLRKIAALLGIFSAIFYTGISIYASSTTLSAFTPISLELSIFLSSAVCTFYTALGGVKAVVWTDALQFLFIFTGGIAILVQGFNSIGGFQNLFDAISRGDRDTMLEFDNGVITRVSPAAVILGSFVATFEAFTMSQQLVQRFQSSKTTKQAQLAMALTTVVNILFGLMMITLGLVMYAYFEGCDPQYSGKITSIDQTVPYMALEFFADVPAVSGIFVAAIYAAAMSTVSSNINSFSMVIVEDLISPRSKRVTNSEKLKVILGKGIVLGLGIISLGIAFAAAKSSSNITQLLFSFTGITNGPLAGTYVLGLFFPWANSVGTTIGLIVSFAFGLFLFIGSEFFKIPYINDIPPRYIDNCTMLNMSTATWEVTETPSTAYTSTGDISHSTIQNLFNLNYNMFGVIGISSSILIGLVASFLSGAKDPKQSDPRFFIPIIDNSCFPESVRKFFRFGVPELKTGDDEDDSSGYWEEDKL